jgi:uncharacterized membrane protein
MFSKHRIEALSDAIFAIVMTLLVLDLKVPETIGSGGLRQALAGDSATWYSFVLTFLLASVYWVLQHQVFDLLEAVSNKSLVATFFFLGFITLLPFSTALMGHHPEPLSIAIYFTNQFGIAITLALKLETARALNHIPAGFDMKVMRVRLYSLCIVMGGSIFAALFLSRRRLWVAPLVLVVLSRAVRSILMRHWKKQGHPRHIIVRPISPEDHPTTE